MKSWAARQAERFAQARAAAPTAEVLRPQAELAARRAVVEVARRGGQARLSVRVSRQRLSVEGQGASAGPALERVRDELSRQRPQMVAAVRQQAQAAMRRQ